MYDQLKSSFVDHLNVHVVRYMPCVAFSVLNPTVGRFIDDLTIIRQFLGSSGQHYPTV